MLILLRGGTSGEAPEASDDANHLLDLRRRSRHRENPPRQEDQKGEKMLPGGGTCGEAQEAPNEADT